MKGFVLSTNERLFVLGALREKLRIDGRRPYDFRNVKISFGMSFGQAEVQIGSTRVLAVVTADIVEPFPDRPTEGFFVFNTEFSPMADPSFEIGRPSEAAIELGRIVERSLRDSRAIDTEALCIKAGDKVWSVRCDMHVLDHGGNLVDCAALAAVSALLHFRRPATAFTAGGPDGQQQQLVVYTAEQRPMQPLSVHHTPLCVSFALFDDGAIVVVDPGLKEEALMDGRLTITVNAHLEICSIQKAGGTPVTTAQLLQCTRIAAVKAEELNETLQAALRAAASSTAAATSTATASSGLPASGGTGTGGIRSRFSNMDDMSSAGETTLLRAMHTADDSATEAGSTTAAGAQATGRRGVQAAASTTADDDDEASSDGGDEEQRQRQQEEDEDDEESGEISDQGGDVYVHFEGSQMDVSKRKR